MNKIIDFLNQQNVYSIQSNERTINGETNNNINLIGLSNIKNNVYKQYECNCGNNGVIYTDGLFYYCLSQAILHDNPMSLLNICNISWKSCNYEYCSCDTFELRSKNI